MQTHFGSRYRFIFDYNVKINNCESDLMRNVIIVTCQASIEIWRMTLFIERFRSRGFDIYWGAYKRSLKICFLFFLSNYENFVVYLFRFFFTNNCLIVTIVILTISSSKFYIFWTFFNGVRVTPIFKQWMLP